LLLRGPYVAGAEAAPALAVIMGEVRVTRLTHCSILFYSVAALFYKVISCSPMP
jgi:hypothetical protein